MNPIRDDKMSAYFGKLSCGACDHNRACSSKTTHPDECDTPRAGQPEYSTNLTMSWHFDQNVVR